MSDKQPIFSRGQRLAASQLNTMSRSITSAHERLSKLAPTVRPGKLADDPALKVKIWNNTGAHLAPRDIAGISGHAFTDDVENICLEVVALDIDNHQKKYVIASTDIPDQGIADGYIPNAVLVKLYAPDEDSLDLEYAGIDLEDPDDSESDPVLQPTASGTSLIIWADEYENKDDNDYVWSIISLGVSAGGGGEPLMYQATADQTGGSGAATVTAKRVAADGTLAETEETLDCYDDAPPIISGDYLVTTQDKDGGTVAVAAFGTLDPTALSGTGATASTSTWDIESQSDAGVEITYVTRTYWSGTAEDPIYYFTRTMKYDSIGCLREISAETRYELTDTKVCS